MNEFLKKLFENVEVVASVENVDVQPGDIYVLGIAREAIERGHVESYLKEFEKLGKRKMRGRVILSFQGYARDPREVYQVPEVRKWMERILKNVHHLFYLLSSENYNMLLAFLCIADVQSRSGERTGVNASGAKALIEKITQAAVSHSKKSGDAADVQFHLANTIMEQTGYDKI